jgi:hypothetical protein
MQQIERYMSRRNLDAYAEIAFARYLSGKGTVPYFPFKDVGIDMIGILRGQVEQYQLKARNEMLHMPGVYWFPLRANLKNLSKIKGKVYFILCALQPNQKDFHFFKVPVREAARYYKLKRHRTAKFFEIKRLTGKNYKIYPTYIHLDVNRFRLE